MKFSFAFVALCQAVVLNSKLDINQQVFIEGTQVLGGTAGESSLNTCTSLAKQFVDHEQKPQVKVCGTNIKATFYLRNRCEDYHHYSWTVGSCDTSKASDSCQTFSPSDDKNFGAAQSYVIEQC